MRNHKLVAVSCKLAPGMFSSELLFTVTMANGETHQGIAPRHFCWNMQGQLIAAYEVTHEVEGKVAARIVDELEDGQFAIEVPDGEVIAVIANHIQSRPTEITPLNFAIVRVAVGQQSVGGQAAASLT